VLRLVMAAAHRLTAAPGVTSPEGATRRLRSGFLDAVWSYMSGGRWGAHLGLPRMAAITRTSHATARSFPRPWATATNSSGGAPASVSVATAMVKLGEAPPGDELAR
jgi:hypothetical protein